MTAPRPCRNCGSALSVGYRYCPQCGQGVPTHRLTVHAILHDFWHSLFHVDRSVVSLLRRLLVRPGYVAANYANGRRKRYIGPFALLVVLVAATSAEIALTGFQTTTASAPRVAAEFLQHHVNLVFFAEVPVLAGFSRLLALRLNYNYAEHSVLAAYTSAMHLVFYAVVLIPGWALLKQLVPDSTIAFIFFALLPLWPVYFAFATFQFHGGQRAIDGLRGLVAALATQLTTLGIATALANAFA